MIQPAMRVLYCDPSKTNSDARAVVRFYYGDCPGRPLRQIELDNPRSEIILKTMIDLVAAEPITALVLVNQAASFTLIRVLATLYNALAYTRGLALYELAASGPFTELTQLLGEAKTYINPHYTKAPNITYGAKSG